MRRTLEDLEKLVYSPSASRRSDVFHEITDILLVDYLGFGRSHEGYQVDPFRPPTYMKFDAKNLDEVASINGKLLSEGVTPKNFVLTFAYERGDEGVRTSSHHETFSKLLNHELMARSILSNTDFGLKKRIVRLDDLNRIFGRLAKEGLVDPAHVALERDFLILSRGYLSLYPKHLYEAAKTNFKA